MHEIGLLSAKLFVDAYCKNKENMIVIDIGGIDDNKTLRNLFEALGMKYICVDIKHHPCVDIVTKPCEKLPFDSGSIDIVVSTSCFEHDPCFWLTFKEMCRIIKKTGYIYITVPSLATYHSCPGDNWRFFYDAGQALAYWSGISDTHNIVYPVRVIETFHMISDKNVWDDFVCIWQRVDKPESDIIVRDEIRSNIGKLEKLLIDNNVVIVKNNKTQ